MPELSQNPRRSKLKTSEVCRLTDTQPYILRFWESEFPQLKPERKGGQPVYRRQDVDVVLRIKQLLYDEEYTIEGARRRLQQELDGDLDPTSPAPPQEPEEAPVVEATVPEPLPTPPIIEMAPRPPQSAEDVEVVDRNRYDDAIDEIQHLQLRVKEIEAALRKADQRARKSEERTDAYRLRIERTLGHLEKLVESLD